MKKVLQYSIFIVITGCVSFIRCKKEDPVASTVTPPPLPPHKIKIKVIEFDTGLPIEGVTVDAVAFPGSAMILMPTDMNGECSFVGNEAAFRNFTKTGYWNAKFLPGDYLSFSPIKLFPGNVTPEYSSGRSYSCDSIVIKLFPKKYITLHIKDSLGLSICSECTVLFAVNGLFRQEATNYSVYDWIGAPDQNGMWHTKLRPHIDTTFQYPVFGNTINTFSIIEYNVEGGWINNYLHRDTTFIPNNGNLGLTITY